MGRHPGLSRIRAALVIAMAAVSLGTALVVLSACQRQERVPQGVRVGDLDLSGSDRISATARLDAYLAGQLRRPLTLRWQDLVWQVTAEEAGFRYDLPQILDQALAAGRAQSWWSRPLGGGTPAAPRQITPTWSVDEAALAALLDRITAVVDRPPHNASYDLRTRQLTADQDGLALDRTALRQMLEAAASGGGVTIALPVRPVPAPVRQADVAAIEKRVLATFSTRVSQADPDRVANIRLAAKRINGTVLRPGQTFSFNRTVGPREPELGFRQAKELYQGEYVLGYGGGVCQVSSTLYNAALLADLQIGARAHHSRPLSYVEVGRDATVAYDYLDFQFTNTEPIPILIAAYLEEDRLVISLLGRPSSAGRRVEVVTRDLTPVAPPVVEEFDENLPWRTREVLKPGEPGYDVTVLRRVYEGTRLIREEIISHDKYPPRPEQVRIGLRPPGLEADEGEVPAETGEPAVSP